MSKYCTKCGRLLQDGEICHCSDQNEPSAYSNAPADGFAPRQNQGVSENFNSNPDYAQTNSNEPVSNQSSYQQPVQSQQNRSNVVTVDTEAVKGMFEDFKERSGISSTAGSNPYEKDLPIIPDCIEAEEGEVLIEQADISKLRNRFLGITYSKAIGRIAVTNKRVIFRAAGRNLFGQNSLLQEFNVKDIYGIDFKKEYNFRFFDLVAAVFLCWVGSMISIALLGFADITLKIVFGLVIGIAGCLPFILMKKHWLFKAFCLGAAFSALMAPRNTSFFLLRAIASYYGYGMNGFQTFMSWLMFFLGLIVLGFIIFTCFVHSLKPNLVLNLKTKPGLNGISVQRKRSSIGMSNYNTGFSEVLPLDDSEAVLKRLGAVIASVQKES